jgi:hypothetical protein
MMQVRIAVDANADGGKSLNLRDVWRVDVLAAQWEGANCGVLQSSSVFLFVAEIQSFS